MEEQGRQLPELELPTVRLFGKDGHQGGKKLVITAQIPLNFTLGNKSVSVPVFVQPASEQACLLGINAIPLLGIREVGSLYCPLHRRTFVNLRWPLFLS